MGNFSLKSLWGCLCLAMAVLAISPAPTYAAKDFKGQVPPELNPQKWFNTEPLNWKKLKGKVVMIEFFSVG